jgi:hypothetical protein
LFCYRLSGFVLPACASTRATASIITHSSLYSSDSAQARGYGLFGTSKLSSKAMADQTIHEKSLLHIGEEEIVQAPSPQGQASAHSNVPMVSVGTNTSRASDGLLSAATTGAEMHHQGIYWRSPIGMVSFLIFGVFASVSHHFYYSSLDGKKVGNDNDQQWALRSDTFFTLDVSRCLQTGPGN